MQNKRPKWYSIVLWAIPISTWIAMVLIFNLRNHPPMKTLLETQNVALLNEVETFLQQKGIVYVRKENRYIAIDASEHSRIAKQINSLDVIKKLADQNKTKVRKGS